MGGLNDSSFRFQSASRRQAPEDIVTDLTRRKMLGVAAAGAVTSLSTSVEAAAPGAPATPPAPSSLPDPNDLRLFVALSSALTGIAVLKLAPTVDPIQVKNEYFAAASADPAFPTLLQIMRSESDPAAAASKVMNDPKLRYLGRSIILAWYLGVWYDPKVLERYNGPGDQAFPVPPVKVISPTAYTQGWTWRVAQAHPMGYSELRYGYWANDPLSLDDYIKIVS
jgi:Membrane bound FAD containing D-sorbitol dehydrogenase